jgi:hypothetical protein
MQPSQPLFQRQKATGKAQTEPSLPPSDEPATLETPRGLPDLFGDLYAGVLSTRPGSVSRPYGHPPFRPRQRAPAGKTPLARIALKRVVKPAGEPEPAPPIEVRGRQTRGTRDDPTNPPKAAASWLERTLRRMWPL